MKNFQKYLESISISKYRTYHKYFNPERYKAIFQKMKEKWDGDRNAYRLYIPLKTEVKKSEIQLEVERFLKEFSIEDIDYISGKARYPGAKNWTNIAKILNKAKRVDLIDKFASDPSRSLKGEKSDLMVCISRHAFDVAGADTDRIWQNCMTLYHYNKYVKGLVSRGGAIKHLLNDVKKGSLIAFLINKDDRNIQDALANINIKPYINEKDPNDYVLVPDNRIYGLNDEDFKNTVFAWCEEFNGEKEGYYKLAKGLYQDNFKRMDQSKDVFKEEEDEYSDYAKQYLPKNEGSVPILDLIHEYKNTIIIDKDKLKMMLPGEDLEIMDDWNQEGELLIFPIAHAWGGIDFKEWSTAEKYLDMLKDMYPQWIEDYEIDTYNNKIVIIFREDIAENYDLELQPQ